MVQPRLGMRLVRTSVLGLAIAATAIGCGGGGAASAAPGASTGATTGPATSAAAPSSAATQAPAASTAQGGGTAGAACDLLSADDAAGVVGGGPLTTESLPGDPSYCSYKAGDGSVKALTSLAQKDAALGYDTWASASDSVKIDGIGDGAIWVPTLATLLVKKGDRVLGITAGTGADQEAQRIDWSKALAAIAAGKM